MRTSSQLVLTFLLNAVWQIALVAALASLGAWLLRNSTARFLHWIWASALLLSIGVPLRSAAKTFLASPVSLIAAQTPLTNDLTIEPIIPIARSMSQTKTR